MEDIIMNNEVIDQVAEQAVEVAVSKSSVNWGKIGAGVFGIGAAVAGTALVIKTVKHVASKVKAMKAAKEFAEEAEYDNGMDEEDGSMDE